MRDPSLSVNKAQHTKFSPRVILRLQLSRSARKRWELFMIAIPQNDDALLTRDQTASALTEKGFPVKAKTLATKATRGGGPPYHKFGPRALYRWGDALEWAYSRMTPVHHSTSEADTYRATDAPQLEGILGTQTQIGNAKSGVVCDLDTKARSKK
jgi:hypothetical protein